MQLNTNTGNFTPDNLIAGIDVPQQVKAVTLKSGQGVVARGTVLGIVTADGLAVKVNSANADGSQTADCILVNDVDTTAGNVVAEAYISGQFNRKALIFGGSDTAAQHETTLRERGIFLSDNISY
ncbi:head decoration protein [Brevibacillus composti]|uniref:Head decoration protein n=1 Tax=Brevibacillus composti TaxID=2796470 RepID=A0A7T5ENA2_9BACL|nr:head decoration protein [Brevibacillus composti]QQE75713.1 head decoration protein [Brevibacillus composti]QUO42739.1 head decoration protein [Brevibacillus composti]